MLGPVSPPGELQSLEMVLVIPRTDVIAAEVKPYTCARKAIPFCLLKDITPANSSHFLLISLFFPLYLTILASIYIVIFPSKTKTILCLLPLSL